MHCCQRQCATASGNPRALHSSRYANLCKLSWHATQGSIDQVDGLLRFETDAEGLMQWDEQIGLVCNRLTTILEAAAAKGLLVEA